MQNRSLLTLFVALLLVSCSHPNYQSGHWPGGGAQYIPLEPVQSKADAWMGIFHHNSTYTNPNSQISPEIAQLSWSRQRALRDSTSPLGGFYSYGFDLSNSGLNARYLVGLVWERENYDLGLAGQYRAFLTYNYKERGWTPELCLGMGCSGGGSDYLIDRPVQWGWGLQWEPYFRYRFLARQALLIGADARVSFIGSSMGTELGKSLIYQNGPWAVGIRHGSLSRSIEGEQQKWTALVQYRTHIDVDSLSWLDKINHLRLQKARLQNGPEALQDGYWIAGLADLGWGGVSWERRHQGLPTADSLQGYDTKWYQDTAQSRFAMIPGIRIGLRTQMGLATWVEWSKYLGTAYATKNRLTGAQLDYSESAWALGVGWVGEYNFWGFKTYLGSQNWGLYDAELTGMGLEYYRRINHWNSWRIGLGGGLTLLDGKSYSVFDFRTNEWRLSLGVRMW